MNKQQLKQSYEGANEQARNGSRRRTRMHEDFANEVKKENEKNKI